jgi:hypothetical protein
MNKLFVINIYAKEQSGKILDEKNFRIAAGPTFEEQQPKYQHGMNEKLPKFICL